MDMLGHDDVAGNVEAVPTMNLIESLLKDAPGLRSSQERCAAVTTKGDEVEVSGFLETVESARHFAKLLFLSAIHRDVNHTSVSTLLVLTRTHPVTKRR